MVGIVGVNEWSPGVATGPDTLRERQRAAQQSLATCDEMVTRLEEALVGAHPRPVTGTAQSSTPKTEPSANERATWLLDGINELRNRLDKLVANI